MHIFEMYNIYMYDMYTYVYFYTYRSICIYNAAYFRVCWALRGAWRLLGPQLHPAGAGRHGGQGHGIPTFFLLSRGVFCVVFAVAVVVVVVVVVVVLVFVLLLKSG